MHMTIPVYDVRLSPSHLKLYVMGKAVPAGTMQALVNAAATKLKSKGMGGKAKGTGMRYHPAAMPFMPCERCDKMNATCRESIFRCCNAPPCRVS
jgi:hypothetical protein